MLTAEELKRMIKQAGHSWAHFESTSRGELVVIRKGFREKILIKMRIGLHMGLSTQALIADDQFIKIRSRPDFDDYVLKKLDPLWPDKCLYGSVTEHLLSRVYKRMEWRPNYKKQSFYETL
jgi:hypothetical protein